MKLRVTTTVAMLILGIAIPSYASTPVDMASPIATASENESGRVASRFAFGSPLLTKAQKAAIEKAVTTFGTDATFIVTAEAGKLPLVSDRWVQLLANKRGQVFKSYLVKLGVNESSVTIKVKITRLGIVPKTKIVGSSAPSLLTVAVANSTGTGSGSGSGTPATTPGAPTSVSATAGNAQSVVSWTAPASTGGATITGYTVTSSPGSRTCTTASTSCTVTGLTNGTAYTFTVTATNSAGTGSASTASSPRTPTAPYLVGATGPGGGIVYYVDNAGFSCGPTLAATCNYLEVAPYGWNTGADPLKPWAFSANQAQDVNGITGGGGGVEIPNNSSVYNNALGIGLGLKNSIAIVAQNGGTYNASTNNYAAGAARAYAGGSKSDWYLPTTAELNLLCQWGRNVTQNVLTVCTGGDLNTGTGASGGLGTSTRYWSSSEEDATDAWAQYFTFGSQSSCCGKSSSYYVRPVRAF
jgi:hypothetical protein